jgi:hypothetical protein
MVEVTAGKFFIFWQYSKLSTAAKRIGQQKRKRLLAPGRWRTREDVDEAVDENKVASEGKDQVAKHRAEKSAGQAAIEMVFLEQCAQDLLICLAPPAPPRVDGTQRIGAV